jgi:3'-phosphoadenosine 5'-phosphosulfate sulfotransferase (PAPS reductase)/FAD synthetase
MNAHDRDTGLTVGGMPDPFLITGPAIISFSGGRTSAYMLWRIIQAHGGALPDDVIPVFANTGREMPATLDFVRDCGAAWGVNVVWLEYRWAPGGPWVEVVSHNNASRDGEPFAALLNGKSALPNPVQRACTQELKIRTMKRYVRAVLGWDHWINVVGLRADEMHRVERTTKPTRERWTVATPLATAGITNADVLAFWRRQPFDLGLTGKWEGNCDGCFLKSRAAIMRMHRDHPERMRWWADMEAVPRGTAGRGRTFRKDREPYAALADLTSRTPMLIPDETMIEGGEACGAYCGV